MAIMKCAECGNSVSDKANMCPQCGYPIGNNETDMDSNISFEKRIEQYLQSGYDLVERQGNSVTLIKPKKSWIVFYFIVTIGICIMWYFGNTFFSLKNKNLPSFLVPLFTVTGLIYSIIMDRKRFRVIVSLTSTGTIQETGYKLK